MIRSTLITLLLMVFAAGCEKPEAPPEGKAAAQDEQTKEQEPPKEETGPPEGAQWVASDTYGVKFLVSDDWRVEKDDSAISATDPEGAITALLLGTESDNMIQAALENVNRKLQFKDVKLKKDGATVVNGLPGYAARGTSVLVGDDGDQEIEFIMTSVRVGDKGVALMIFAEAEMYEAKKEEIDGLSKTLQKL